MFAFEVFEVNSSQNPQKMKGPRFGNHSCAYRSLN